MTGRKSLSRPKGVTSGRGTKNAHETSKVERFLCWLNDNGASASGIRLRIDDGVREICARRAVEGGGMLMHIPRHLIITPELARSSEIGRRIEGLGVRFTDYGYIAAFLLQNRSEDSFFKPFVDVLPEDMSENPILFGEAELDILQGSASLEEIRLQIEWMRYEYRQIADFLDPACAFTERDYAWAKAIVRSRTFGLEFYGVRTVAMVPLADMLDHASGENARWFRESACGFLYTASRRIDEGTPLTTTYGDTKGNGALFRVYGFCLDDNAHDDTELVFDEPEDCMPDLAHPPGETREGRRVFKAVADYADESTGKMFSYLRLRSLIETADPDIARLAASGPLGVENELAALAMLSAACRKRIAEFATSIEDDGALLESGLSGKLRNLVTVRHGEKRVLRYFLRLADAGLALLQSGAEGDVSNACKDAGDDFIAYRNAILPLLAKAA